MRTMRPVTYLCALVLGAGAAVGLGCGSGGGSIDRTDARQIQGVLDQVSAAINDGRCAEAQAAALQARSEVSNLEGRIPAKLQRNLEEGVSALRKATPGDCADVVNQRQQTETPTTDTTVETTTTEQPVETATTETTDTAPPETTPADTTDTSTEPPSGGATPEPTPTPTPTDTTGQGNGTGGEQG